MNRVHFKLRDFPKFNKYAIDIRNNNYAINYTWEDVFAAAGYKTYQFGNFHSLSEEEYTWFVLRWS